jgi:tetratricopeptide (TPR) repeat protein
MSKRRKPWIHLEAALAAFFMVASVFSASPANAAWIRVETDKFVVYGSGSEKSVREYATRLNTYDQVLRRFHPATLARKPATKVHVFMVPGAAALRRVQPNARRYTAGFYAAMNEGVYAVALKNAEGLGGDDVLFHEYAHHFMWENFPAAYPAWFVEGFAEYFMTMEIKPAVIKVGGYNPARAYGVLAQTWVPLEELLGKTTWQTSNARVNAYYAQAWLLMHYMRSDPARAAQLNKATREIADGADPVKALEAATGLTLAQLTSALRGYRELQIISLTGNMPPPPSMTVTTLPRSADDLLLDNLRLILSPTGQVDAELLADVRRKAAKHPGDRLAETTLARAEFVMGDVAAGEAIMQRRLAAAPQDAEELLLAGTGQLMAGMRDAKSREDRYRAARPLLIKAYQLNDSDFRPLYAYALSRTVEPVFPNDNDLNALLEARRLAPSVMEMSMRAGVALLQKGRKDEAMRMLAPVLNNPHGGQAAARARELLNQGRTGALNLEPFPEEDEEESPPPAPDGKPAT